MVASLEEFVAQATQAYQPAQTAIQNQINALSGQLETANQQINKNYAQQQAGLNRQRNMAAETASMQAAGSGGSFGGAANLANRKYYDQTFVPAQTQLQTNQANELAQMRQNYENQRTSLNSQLSNLESQANQLALQKYWAEVEAERERQFQAEQAEKNRQASVRAAKAAAASNPLQYLDDGYSSSSNVSKSNVEFEDWLKNYSGYNTKTINSILSTLKVAGSARNLPGGASISNALASPLKSYYNAYNNWRSK